MITSFEPVIAGTAPVVIGGCGAGGEGNTFLGDTEHGE